MTWTTVCMEWHLFHLVYTWVYIIFDINTLCWKICMLTDLCCDPLLYKHLTLAASWVLAVLMQPWWCSFPSLEVPTGGWDWFLTGPLSPSHQLRRSASKYSPPTWGIEGSLTRVQLEIYACMEIYLFYNSVVVDYSVVALWTYSQLIVCKRKNSHIRVCCISSSRNWWWTKKATTYSQMESIVDMTLYLLLYPHSDCFSPHSVKRALSFGDLHYSGKVKAHEVAVVNSHNPDVLTHL